VGGSVVTGLGVVGWGVINPGVPVCVGAWDGLGVPVGVGVFVRRPFGLDEYGNGSNQNIHSDEEISTTPFLTTETRQCHPPYRSPGRCTVQIWASSNSLWIK
jgi:hypothetical protein